MIKLNNIVKSDFEIRCSAIVEDCQIPFELIYDIKNDILRKYELPKGYEWCRSHISHALRYFRSVKNKDNLPSQELLMWY